MKRIAPELWQIAQLMTDFPQPWGICGGWALDLFLGYPTRPHKDVDLAILRRDQLTLQTYLNTRGWTLEKAYQDELVPWSADEFITLPIHTIWGKNPKFVPDFLEILLNETSRSHFLFRRDRSISLPLKQAFVPSQWGLPILAPEVVLLYKAKYVSSEANSVDFQRVLPALDQARRVWLKAALDKLHPGHDWLTAL